MPRVSVLLPVRDAVPWLATSLASLWRQSLRDFEVVAVDDGSRDGTPEILARAARAESRLRVFVRPAAGLPAALECARAHAHAPLLARHDADDVSHRERFAAQARHLGEHPDVAVVGSRVRLFPAAASGLGMRRWGAWHDGLLTHEAMHAEMLIDSPLAHGSAMIRASALADVGGWQERGWAEDLDLWVRLFESGARFAKLPRRLYGWRQHAQSATRTDPRYAHERFMALKLAALDRGLLADGRRATLVGVGASLLRWREALGARVAVTHAARRATSAVFTAHPPPFVLCYLAPAVRSEWREAADSCGLHEIRDFIFVA